MEAMERKPNGIYYPEFVSMKPMKTEKRSFRILPAENGMKRTSIITAGIGIPNGYCSQMMA